MRSTWNEAWLDLGWRRALVIGILAGLVLAYFLPDFFSFIEKKPGFVFHDPMLALFGPIEVSVITFAVLYSLVFIGIILLLRSPYRFVRMTHAYILLLIMRMVSMYGITLEAPATIIPLIDPITQNFYPADEPFLKDLFFSGHTATSVLFALAVGVGAWRWIFGVGALIIGSLVILQHVHYSVDVLAAPFFATVAWAVAGSTMRFCGAGPKN